MSKNRVYGAGFLWKIRGLGSKNSEILHLESWILAKNKVKMPNISKIVNRRHIDGKLVWISRSVPPPRNLSSMVEVIVEVAEDRQVWCSTSKGGICCGCKLPLWCHPQPFWCTTSHIMHIRVYALNRTMDPIKVWLHLGNIAYKLFALQLTVLYLHHSWLRSFERAL